VRVVDEHVRRDRVQRAGDVRKRSLAERATPDTSSRSAAASIASATGRPVQPVIPATHTRIRGTYAIMGTRFRPAISGKMRSVDEDVAAWLAAATGMDPAQVAADLELSRQRRTFVAHELVDAGYDRDPATDLLMRLTGLEAREARALVDEELAHAVATPPPLRDERLAENEIRFRERNEVTAHVLAHDDPAAAIELVCECSDSSCARTLAMPLSEYEWLRQDPLRFVLLPGHEAPAVEDVVERHETYVIVEKHAETHRQVATADPRHS
jgi:hypothetical protein